MKPKYDLLKSIGPGIRDLMLPSPAPTDLQVVLLRLALREAERSHYGGRFSELQPEAGISNRA
jgi:hypothetical protein